MNDQLARGNDSVGNMMPRNLVFPHCDVAVFGAISDVDILLLGFSEKSVRVCVCVSRGREYVYLAQKEGAPVDASVWQV